MLVLQLLCKQNLMAPLLGNPSFQCRAALLQVIPPSLHGLLNVCAMLRHALDVLLETLVQPFLEGHQTCFKDAQAQFVFVLVYASRESLQVLPNLLCVVGLAAFVTSLICQQTTASTKDGLQLVCETVLQTIQAVQNLVQRQTRCGIRGRTWRAERQRPQLAHSRLCLLQERPKRWPQRRLMRHLSPASLTLSVAVNLIMPRRLDFTDGNSR
mmetsp:Transcript_113457/g.196677  ORF Transcript_113457/g.196677 Transcript_113457/m.196677 type:complete len:212 (+) Transcript_113457:3119-3754(+)